MHQTGFHSAGAALSWHPAGAGGSFARNPEPWEDTQRAGMDCRWPTPWVWWVAKWGISWTWLMALPSAVSKTTLPFHTCMESHKFRLVNPDATFCWKKKEKAKSFWSSSWLGRHQRWICMCCEHYLCCPSLWDRAHCSTHIKVLSLELSLCFLQTQIPVWKVPSGR